MPWLVGTALIHSQAVTEKRGNFRAWTLLLSIFAFSLSLLGTFLVRSGVLTSVHAFATDPERGLFILIFLGVVAGGALLLYAIRAPMLAAGKEQPFAPVSRESLVMVNNLMMVSACAMVLLGTLYPLMADALGMGKVSVGPPYFGFLFTLLMVPVVLFAPFGPLSRWRRDELRTLLLPARSWIALALLATGATWLLFTDITAKTLLGALGATWVMAGTLAWVWSQFRDPARRAAMSGGRLGMVLAHFGLGVFVAGVLVHESTAIERDVRMAPGDTVQIRGYDVTFERLDHYEGPNYVSDKGIFNISRDGRPVITLKPAKRRYLAGGDVMTEADIDAGFTRDLYISMGEPVGEGQAWAVRLYHKPLVRWIWLGTLLMMLGGFVAAADRRYRRADATQRGPAEPMPAAPQGAPA